MNTNKAKEICMSVLYRESFSGNKEETKLQSRATEIKNNFSFKEDRTAVSTVAAVIFCKMMEGKRRA